MRNRFDREGQRVGDYHLLRGLGKGGFGDVYLGEHIREHTHVAVKVLRARLTRSEELKEFINEARTIRLKHHHILSLLDFGIGTDDVPFLVMAYAPHGSLRDRHPKGTCLPFSTIVSYVTPIASALQYAHDQHLIHRDVKPENMLLGLHQEVLLSDFGIAAVAHSSHSFISYEGIGGTLPYMAPEQILGKPRPASDQYALGVVVYEWLCGIRPFDGMSVELAMQHQIALPPSLREQVPILTQEGEQVVLRALAKEPKERFARVQDFAEALEAALLSAYPSFTLLPSDVPAVAPLLVETANQQGDLPGTETELALPQPVLEPGPVSTHPKEQTPERVTQGGTSPVVPVSKRAYPDPQREVTPQNIHRNSFFPGRAAVLIGLVLLIIAGSVGIAFATLSHSPLDSNLITAAQATATAHSQATAHTLATVTGAANAYAQYVATNGMMFGFNAQHTGVNPYEYILSPTTVSGLTEQWEYPTGDVIISSPAVANGVVYIGSYDRNVYALDATSGREKWAYQTGGSVESSPAVANGVVYIGSFDGNVYAIDASSGREKWAYQTGGDVESSPAVANGVVYIGSDDKSLYALDATSGRKKWVYQTGSFIWGSSPAVANGVVYINPGYGNIYALDATSGRKKWVYQTAYPTNGSPAVANGVVYFGWGDGNVYALDATSGRKKWAYQSGSHFSDSSPAVAHGVVYIGSYDGNVYAIDATSGREKWVYQTGGKIDSLPAVANGVVYVSSAHNVYALDASSGRKKWASQTEFYIGSSPAVANGVVYFGSDDRYLYAFDLASPPS